jgi:hypothetical protein
MGCAAVAGLSGVLAYVAERANTRQVQWNLLPERPLDTRELEASKGIMDARLRCLQRELPVSSWQVAATDRGLRLALTGRRNFQDVTPALCRRGLLELRLVEPVAQDGPDVPDGCEALLLREEMMNLKEIQEPVVRETRLVVRKQPEMTCPTLKKVGYQTHGIQMRTVITLEFQDSDGKRFSEITAGNVGRQLAVVMDSEIQVAPRIEQEVKGGTVQLLGIKMRAQARRLADFLRIGALPCAFQAVPAAKSEPPAEVR